MAVKTLLCKNPIDHKNEKHVVRCQYKQALVETCEMP